MKTSGISLRRTCWCLPTVCGWTKEPPRQRVTWWWNDNVDTAIKEKQRLWKGWNFKNKGDATE